jgi:hypothetical protein
MIIWGVSGGKRVRSSLLRYTLVRQTRILELELNCALVAMMRKSISQQLVSRCQYQTVEQGPEVMVKPERGGHYDGGVREIHG